MKVFKFGGASIKDADAVRNMCSIVEHYGNEKLIIVVSAMGKTTNALENVIELKKQNGDYKNALIELNKFHLEIIESLFDRKGSEIASEVENLLLDISNYLDGVESFEGQINESYDWVVSNGEIISSKIIHHYLMSSMPIEWVDARNVIKTDTSFREAKVDWDLTRLLMSEHIVPVIENKNVITQGFIGSTRDHRPTTLGREGSDFTGAIFANCHNAESLTIWKDVDGILNADPKIMDDATKYEQLSYTDAAEMTYYGASVIHPKTIKPLTLRNIPLLVRSFTQPFEKGTVIDESKSTENKPAIIFKKKQTLIRFEVRDFTFINERNLSLIFHTLDMLNIKINLMQNSAISLSICIDNQSWKIDSLSKKLKNDFDIHCIPDLTLVSVKNYLPDTIERVSKDQIIFLEQRTRDTFQIVIKP